MAIVSHKHRFIYLLNPRTASTATGQALLKSTQCHVIPKEDILDDDGKILVPKKHTTLRQLRELGLMEKARMDGYFKFVTVRNPFDSVVSSWAKKVKDYAHLLEDPESWVNRKPGYAEGLRRAAGLSFPEWVAQEYGELARGGAKSTINMPFVRGTDHQLRYEHLADDMDTIRDRLGVGPAFSIPRLNVTKGRKEKDYRAYYDAASIEIIDTVFREEISTLGYAF